MVAASTSASLSTSEPTGTWGAEQGIVFTGSVTNTQSGSTGTPTGTITVEQGATVICTIQLPSGSGTGTCTPGPTGLAPGTDEAVTAIYDGDTNFGASAASAPVTETIVEAATTVTAQRQTMVYGGGVPSLTTTVSGLVAGQTLATSGINGQAACTTTATGASGVGDYPITCSVGTLSSPDYAFSFAPGTLTISQATTTTSVNVSASMVTVSVAPQFSGSPPGTVAVSVGGTTASCTLVRGQRTLQLFGAGTGLPGGRGLHGDRELRSECRLRRLFGNRPAAGGGLEHRFVVRRKLRRGHSRQPRDGRGQRVHGVFRWHDVDRERRRRQRQCEHRGLPDPPAACGHRRGRGGGPQQTARQAQQQAALVQAATNEFLYLLHNMKARSLPPGLAGAQSGSTTVRRQVSALVRHPPTEVTPAVRVG